MSNPKEKKHTYTKFLNKRTRIWDHYTTADDRLTAKCNLCNNIIKTGGGSTSGLHRHMRTMHPLHLETDESPASTSISPSCSFKRKNTEDEPHPKIKKIKITDYYESSDCMELVVSRLAALDGIPLSKFCTSDDLRTLFIKAGYDNLPSSPATITNIITKETAKLTEQFKILFSELKARDQRFSLTFDEYTATNNKRFMNINIHNKDLDHDKHKNLGLVRIEGSMPADVGMQYLKDHLLVFGVHIQEDIIAFTTDGASVMTKMGKDFDGHHQICMAHGLQLGVIDVLYKYKIQSTSDDPGSSWLDAASDDSDDDDLDKEDDQDDSLYIIQPKPKRGPELYFKDLISKTRKLVKLFRKSPTKNDLLQKYVKEEHGKELQLILDVRTRWSSMSDMIGRFLKLKNSVKKALIDLKLGFPFDEQELQTLQDISKSLEVVKATLLAICKRDANLLTADVALKFMLKKLDRQANVIGDNLAAALRRRIKERRLPISGVLQYLHDAEAFYSDNEDIDTFKNPTTDETRQTLVHLLTRLKYRNIHTSSSQEQDQSDDDVLSAHDSSGQSDVVSVEKELERELLRVGSKDDNARRSRQNTDVDAIIRVEMCVYDSAGGGRGKFLTAAYQCLLSVVPTSVEAERAFSSVCYICNKLRSSLSDSSLNALLMLRSNFQNQKNK